MSSPALRLVAAQHEHVGPDTSWLEWLKAHVDPEWRTSEWDPCSGCSPAISTTPGPPPGRAARRDVLHRRVATTAAATPAGGTG